MGLTDALFEVIEKAMNAYGRPCMVELMDAYHDLMCIKGDADIFDGEGEFSSSQSLSALLKVVKGHKLCCGPEKGRTGVVQAVERICGLLKEGRSARESVGIVADETKLDFEMLFRAVLADRRVTIKFERIT